MIRGGAGSSSSGAVPCIQGCQKSHHRNQGMIGKLALRLPVMPEPIHQSLAASAIGISPLPRNSLGIDKRSEQAMMARWKPEPCLDLSSKSRSLSMSSM